MHSKISRRDFLKLAGIALGGLAFSPYAPSIGEFDDGTWIRITSSGVQNLGIPVRSKPTDQSPIVRSVFRDDLLHVYEEINSGTPEYNPIWYHIWGGYVHRAHTQKVQYIYNDPAKSIRESKQLAEVSVPYTQALRLVGKDWVLLNRLYYQSVHWVVGVDDGPDGQPWYRVLDAWNNITYNVPATHLRLIPDEELAPISPEVPLENKRIEVSLGMQTISCYEYDKVVLQTNISSGLETPNLGKNGISTLTPAGDFRIEVKMPSQHMGNGSLASDLDAYELLGVPWVSFFKNPPGYAFHGTYWHDNFGTPMSHGCVNMRTEEAKWLFRWGLPAAPAAQINQATLDKRGWGTGVKIRG